MRLAALDAKAGSLDAKAASLDATISARLKWRRFVRKLLAAGASKRVRKNNAMKENAAALQPFSFDRDGNARRSRWRT